MHERAAAYLEALRYDPTLSREDLAERVGVSPFTVLGWRQNQAGFREAEREITNRHKFEQARVRVAKAVAIGDEDPIRTELPESLIRFLEVYEETDNRVETIRKLKDEGISISLTDLEDAITNQPAFRHRFAELWRLGDVEVEDQLRFKARKGKNVQAVSQYLKANMPKKYGERIRHIHEGGIQLLPEHDDLVKEQKDSFVKRYQRKAARAAVPELVSPVEAEP